MSRTSGVRRESTSSIVRRKGRAPMAEATMLGSEPAVSVRGRSGTLVLIGGAASTAVALLAVYFLNETGTNVMGWYADYVLPIGALLVGLLASSGFGVAS